MNKIFFYISALLIPLSSMMMTGCVEYEAEDFTGKTLPRKTGYSTGVTNDWLYFNLQTGARFNVLNPNQSIITQKDGISYDPADTLIYWSEGMQKNATAWAIEDKYADKSTATRTTEWDIAFNGYRMRTNSGTSGIGMGGAVDLGYGEYDKWTSKEQVDAYMAQKGLSFAVDDSASVSVTMSQNDWNKYLIRNNLDFNENPWFDPNKGPATQIVSANPVLAEAMSFSGPPPVYAPSFHTYCIRSYDGERYYKIQIVSWYDANVQIGDEGGRMSYYLDELK